jgi:hypothetical protein
MGANEGNLLYINSVARALNARGQKVETGGYLIHREDDPSEWIAETNRRYDAFVIPLANAFRFGYSPRLARYTEIIKRLDIPVFVIGVGAQATLDQADQEGSDITMGHTGAARKLDPADVERHNGIVRDFVSAVLEKSALIGVRGDVTKRYLTGIGIDPNRVQAIGCPSLYTWGGDFSMKPKLAGGLQHDSAIGMSVDYRISAMAETVQLNTDEYSNLVSPVQDDRSARLVVSGEEKFDMSRVDPRMPTHRGHRLYQEGRLLYYPSPWAWIESYRDREFTFGTRLHGTIAGLLGGVPGHLLVHDTRTLELAEFHKIPYSLMDHFASAPTAEELYERTEMGPFLENHPVLFSRYVDFLHANGFKTAFDGRGTGARAFDRKVARISAPTAVKPSVFD